MLLTKENFMRYFVSSLLITGSLMTILYAFKNYNDGLILDLSTKTETLKESLIQIESDIEDEKRKLLIQERKKEMLLKYTELLSNLLVITFMLVIVVYLVKIMMKKAETVATCVTDIQKKVMINQNPILFNTITIPEIKYQSLYRVLYFFVLICFAMQLLFYSMLNPFFMKDFSFIIILIILALSFIFDKKCISIIQTLYCIFKRHEYTN